MLKKHDY